MKQCQSVLGNSRGQNKFEQLFSLSLLCSDDWNMRVHSRRRSHENTKIYEYRFGSHLRAKI